MSTPRRGRGPFISSPRPRPSPGRGFGSQTTFANLQPRKARPSKSAAAACTQQGWKPFGLPSRLRRPRTAKSKILTPRRRSGPSGRVLYHFPSRPNLGFAGLGFRFCGALWAVLEPPAAQSAAFDFSPRAAFHLPGVPALRSAKALSSNLQPRKRGLRPAVTEGDKGGRALARLATAN